MTSEYATAVSSTAGDFASKVVVTPTPSAPVVTPVTWEELMSDDKVLRVDSPKPLTNKTVELRIELGQTYIDRDEASHLRSGTLLPLDNATSEPLALYADGQLFAWGEAVVVEGKLGIRVLELA